MEQPTETRWAMQLAMQSVQQRAMQTVQKMAHPWVTTTAQPWVTKMDPLLVRPSVSLTERQWE